jgi:hypothetical protein
MMPPMMPWMKRTKPQPPAVPKEAEEGPWCGTPGLDDWNLLEPQPATDWLAVFGVGTAVVAFLLWAWSSPWPSRYNGFFWFEQWFTTDRLPAVAAFLVASFVLLLLRRR